MDEPYNQLAWRFRDDFWHKCLKGRLNGPVWNYAAKRDGEPAYMDDPFGKGGDCRLVLTDAAILSQQD